MLPEVPSSAWLRTSPEHACAQAPDIAPRPGPARNHRPMFSLRHTPVPADWAWSERPVTPLA